MVIAKRKLGFEKIAIYGSKWFSEPFNTKKPTAMSGGKIFFLVKSILNKVHAKSKAPHGISNRFI